jgi:outer membrane protein assembly factor BamE (lipoprotein component of BamABCDE complex)
MWCRPPAAGGRLILPKLPAFPSRARLFAAALALALLGACTPPAFIGFPPQVRGNMVDESMLSQLVIGTSARKDVAALLGSPTAHATFDDNTWLYISEVTRPQIAGTQGVQAQGVLVLTFDQAGVLRDITHRTQADAVPVEVVSRTTPSPGRELSFFQQLIGNVGKFSPAATDSQTAPAGGAPSSHNY